VFVIEVWATFSAIGEHPPFATTKIDCRSIVGGWR
jgi:hypothetical protein